MDKAFDQLDPPKILPSPPLRYSPLQPLSEASSRTNSTSMRTTFSSESVEDTRTVNTGTSRKETPSSPRPLKPLTFAAPRAIQSDIEIKRETVNIIAPWKNDFC